MMKFKFAFVFMIVLVMYLQQSQGHIVSKKSSKLPIVAAKVTVAKSAAAKIKLAAFKKWAAVKTIVKAPFVLGKKAALFKLGAVKSLAAAKVGVVKSLATAKIGAVKSVAAAKIGAVKSLGAFKLAKAKKALGFASKKAAPAVVALSTVTKKVGPAVAAVAAIPAAAVAAIPAIAAIPAAAVAAIPAAASAAIKPLTDLVSPSKPEEEEEAEAADVYTVPIRETHFQIVQPDVHYSSNVANSYSEHGYSVNLLPSGEYSNVYQYYPAAGVKYDTAVAAERVEENRDVPSPQTDTEVVVPHDIYGVPN